MKYKYNLFIFLCLFLTASFLHSETKSAEKAYPAQGSPPRKLEQGQDGHWTANKTPVTGEGYETHTVKSGDTLWDITREYLKDPFLWPQIWELNSNIRNPHWIYPGDKILLKKMVVMAPAAASSPVPSVPQSPTAEPVQTAAPQTPGSEALSQPVQSAPTPPVAAATPSPAANYKDLYCAGFFSGEKLSPLAAVIGGEESEHRSYFSDRDIVYLSKGTSAGIKPGDVLQIVRPDSAFAKWGAQFGSASSKSKYGYYYHDIGRMRVLFAQENAATAQVELSCSEVSVEDLVIPGEDRVSPPQREGIEFEKFAPPSGKLQGKIFMTKEFRTQVGSGNVVFVSFGRRENTQVGSYLRISRKFNNRNISLFNINDYRQHRSSFDEVRKVIGEAVVLRVEEKVSTCLITYSTEEITLGDDVEIE